MRFGITLSKAALNSEAFNRQLYRAVGPNESLICRMPRADPLLWFKGSPSFVKVYIRISESFIPQSLPVRQAGAFCNLQ